jgi:hypothetical protein
VVIISIVADRLCGSLPITTRPAATVVALIRTSQRSNWMWLSSREGNAA